MLDLAAKYAPALWGGLKVTLAMSALVWLVGIVIGTAAGTASYKSKFAARVISIGAFLVSSIPALALLFWIHYPLQAQLKTVVDPFWTSVAVFSVINIAMVASTVKEAGDNLPRAYGEAAAVCSIPAGRTFLVIELPLILRASTAPLVSAQVTVLHLTLFASLISVEELFRVAQQINSIEYKPVEIYTIIAFIYLSVSLPINGIAMLAKKRFSGDSQAL